MGSSVASIFSIVVLPAPLGPSTPKTSPRRTSRSTWSTARWSPNVLSRSSARTAGVVSSMGTSLGPAGFAVVSPHPQAGRTPEAARPRYPEVHVRRPPSPTGARLALGAAHGGDRHRRHQGARRGGRPDRLGRRPRAPPDRGP